MVNVLIIGGAGFIGSNLANHFLQQKNNVTIFDNISRKGSEKNIEWLRKQHKNINFVRDDVRSLNGLSKAMKDADVVFHTASQVAVTSSIKNPREDFEINALGTFNVLEATRMCKNNPIIIFTSSNKVYGDNVNKITLEENESRYDYSEQRFKKGIPEDFPTDSDVHSPYGCSKYVADMYMREYHNTYGLKTVVLRLSCIYGILQHGTTDQGWISYFLKSALSNHPIVIYGDGKQVRDILYISDLVTLFDLILKDSGFGEVYNIGGGYENTISLLELIEFLKEKFKLELKHSFSDWRQADQKVYYSDISKAKNDLKWTPTVSKEEGITKMYEWLRTTEEMK